MTTLPALVTLFPIKLFTNREAIGCINKATIGANKEAMNPLSCFFLSCFIV